MSVTHARLDYINDETRSTYNAGGPAPASNRSRFTMIPADASKAARKLGALNYAVYCYLCERANRSGECWPSYQTIADDLRLSRRHIVRLVKDLATADLITVEARKKATGDATSNLIRIHEYATQGSDSDNHVVVTQVHHLVTDSHQGSDRESPKLNVIELNTGKENVKDPPTPQRSKPSRKRTDDELAPAALARFERWYTSYPKKEARADAERAWAKIDPDDALVTTMIETLAWQVPTKNWTEANYTFIPYPASYLNGKRWRDTKPPPEMSSATNGRVLSRADRAARAKLLDALGVTH